MHLLLNATRVSIAGSHCCGPGSCWRTGQLKQTEDHYKDHRMDEERFYILFHNKTIDRLETRAHWRSSRWRGTWGRWWWPWWRPGAGTPEWCRSPPGWWRGAGDSAINTDCASEGEQWRCYVVSHILIYTNSENALCWKCLITLSLILKKKTKIVV